MTVHVQSVTKKSMLVNFNAKSVSLQQIIAFVLNELPKHPMVGPLCFYTLSRWDGLTRFIDDGRIEICSNTVERSIRPIALNRKNALFAGSDAGAEHWATIASLIETAKLNGVEPLAYLSDILTRIVSGHPNSQLDNLLPWAYVENHKLKAVA